jgi:alpha-beta hydrolase superfamily lysophospholipase
VVRGIRAAFLLAAAVAITACGASAATSTTTAAAPTANPSTTEQPEEGVALTFATADGFTLEGRRFGAGTDWVVLAHMRPADMEAWFPFARTLAVEGYSALAFNFRGYGASEGSGFAVDVDVTAAIDEAFRLGAGRVFVAGASMGGTGAVAAAAGRPVAAVVTLSAPDAFEGVDAVAAAARLTAPLLLIAAEGNAPYPDDARAIAAASAGPAEVVVLSGSRHGTDMFADHDPELGDRILTFFAATP